MLILLTSIHSVVIQRALPTRKHFGEVNEAWHCQQCPGDTSLVKGPPTCRWWLQASLHHMPATEPSVPLARRHCPAVFHLGVVRVTVIAAALLWWHLQRCPSCLLAGEIWASAFSELWIQKSFQCCCIETDTTCQSFPWIYYTCST